MYSMPRGSRMDVENFDRVVKRKATFADIDLLSDVTKQIEGHTICAFGEGSAWPVQGLLRHLEKKLKVVVERNL